LAHNLLVWARPVLARLEPGLGQYGLLRLVRDGLQISGRVWYDRPRRIVRIRVNRKHRLARAFVGAFTGDDLSLILG